MGGDPGATINAGFARFSPAYGRTESCFPDRLGRYNGPVDRIFSSIARKGVWLLLAGLLALGAGQTIAGASGGGAPLVQAHQMTDSMHGGWRMRHSGAAAQDSRGRPDDGATERMRCLLACMALNAQVDVLLVDLPPRPSPHVEPVRLAPPLGKTQIRPRPHPGPPRHALSV